MNDLARELRILRAERGLSRKQVKEGSSVSTQRIRVFEQEGEGLISDLDKLLGFYEYKLTMKFEKDGLS